MSKAILVIDEMPKNCEKCGEIGWMPPYGHCCMARLGKDDFEQWRIIDDLGKRLDMCPLRPLPEKHESYTGTEFGAGYEAGWNACLYCMQTGINPNTEREFK